MEVKTKREEIKMAVVAMKQLLEAGVHLDIKQEDGTQEWLNTYSKLEMVSI